MYLPEYSDQFICKNSALNHITNNELWVIHDDRSSYPGLKHKTKESEAASATGGYCWWTKCETMHNAAWITGLHIYLSLSMLKFHTPLAMDGLYCARPGFFPTSLEVHQEANALQQSLLLCYVLSVSFPWTLNLVRRKKTLRCVAVRCINYLFT